METGTATGRAMAVCPPQEVRDTERSTLTPFLGPLPSYDLVVDDAAHPHAFRPEQKPGADLGVHYHLVAQFQLFVSGTGHLGRHEVRRGTLHYTDALTPYGPLRPGNVKLGYLTLRARIDAGAYFMPDCREPLAEARSRQPGDSGHRNLTFDLTDAGDGSLIDDADGLRVALHRLAPGSTTTVLPTRGECRYGYVFGGTVSIDDGDGAVVAPLDSLLYGVPTEPYELSAPAGATYVELDLPATA